MIEAMQGVVIAMQRMHIELYVYESSTMELVGDASNLVAHEDLEHF